MMTFCCQERFERWNLLPQWTLNFITKQSASMLHNIGTPQIGSRGRQQCLGWHSLQLVACQSERRAGMNSPSWWGRVWHGWWLVCGTPGQAAVRWQRAALMESQADLLNYSKQEN